MVRPIAINHFQLQPAPKVHGLNFDDVLIMLGMFDYLIGRLPNHPIGSDCAESYQRHYREYFLILIHYFSSASFLRQYSAC
jgi:hypothetical protein